MLDVEVRLRQVAPVQMRSVRQPLLEALAPEEVNELGRIATALIARLETMD